MFSVSISVSFFDYNSYSHICNITKNKTVQANVIFHNYCNIENNLNIYIKISLEGIQKNFEKS